MEDHSDEICPQNYRPPLQASGSPPPLRGAHSCRKPIYASLHVAGSINHIFLVFLFFASRPRTDPAFAAAKAFVSVPALIFRDQELM
jgi:hypothetical protein